MNFKKLTDDPIQVAKINSIISQISISCIENAVADWLNSEDQSVLEASLFITAYLNPEYDRDRLFFEIEKIRKTVWLELNDYLIPVGRNQCSQQNHFWPLQLQRC